MHYQKISLVQALKKMWTSRAKRFNSTPQFPAVSADGSQQDIGMEYDGRQLRMEQFSIFGSVCSAFAPGKEAWKRQGNFYTSEELRAMDEIDEITLTRPLNRVLSAD